MKIAYNVRQIKVIDNMRDVKIIKNELYVVTCVSCDLQNEEMVEIPLFIFYSGLIFEIRPCCAT